MTDQVTNQPVAVPLALAEPTATVRRGWVAGLSLSSLAMWMAAYTPLQVLLPTQLQDITPSGKIVALAIVTGVGAVASALATPVAGALSDRTTHRFGVGRLRGRRHRWTLVLCLLAAASLVALSRQRSVAGVTLLWVMFCIFQNGEYASLSAAIPDHVPVRQRATVAGWFSLPQAVGVVVGTILVVRVFTGLTSGYLALAVGLAALTLPFVLFTRDHPLEPELRAPLSWRELARSYWISPRAYPDFAWAWLTRFCMCLAVSMGTLYLLYFLRDAIHYSKLFPGQTAADGLLILILIYTAGIVLTAIVGGIISDRLGRRKVMVTVAGVVVTAAAVLLVFVETWHSVLLAAVLYGLGYGAYLAVDQALITQVLPAASDRAKDLGVINIALVCPAAIGSLIAAPMVSLGGYPTLYAGTGIAAFIGAIGVWRVKSVR